MPEDQLDKQIEKFTRFKALMDEYESDGITADEVKELLEVMAGIVLDFKESFAEQITFSNKEGERKYNSLLNYVQRLESALQGIAGDLENTKSTIPEETDLSPLEEAITELRGRKIPTKVEIIALANGEIPKLAKNIRDSLSSLEGDERLDKSAIKGLDEELKRIDSRVTAKTSGGVRRVFQPYQDDLSSSCNGVNKTFYLSRAPLSEVIFVFGTDFPTILRPTIDFTVANKVLTLTSAVPAPNEGATLLIQYYA